MLRFFEKKAFGGCKSQIHVIGYRIAGRETELGSLSDAEWGSETILIGKELARRPFCESGGSAGQFVELMDRFVFGKKIVFENDQLVLNFQKTIVDRFYTII